MITAEYYPEKFDKIYRFGYILQIFGILLDLFSMAQYAVNIPLIAPLNLGLWLFTAGVLLSAWFLLVWDIRVKIITVSAAWFGLSVWATGYLLQSPEYSIIWPFGFGLVGISAAGLTGKEAYCFQITEGWLLLGLYPIITFLWFIVSLGYMTAQPIFVVLKGVWLLLMISFTVKKMQKKLMSCQAGTCK